MAESAPVIPAGPKLAWKLSALMAAALAFAPAAMDSPRPAREAVPARGVEIVERGGYPELRVDGAPFFLHSAAFFYDRVPRDLWERVLDRYRSLGINTIEIYIPWNWHEPREGEFDFDGRTNPRRNLRALLQLAAERGFKLVARPGPQILNEWRHGGYPEWLLERPEYKMELVDRLEGHYPPLSSLNTRDAEAAAKGWLENPTHMAYARKWLDRVARELAPYGARRTVNVAMDNDGRAEPREVSGPLLFVQLEDDLAAGRTNNVGPIFWRYLDALRGMLEAGGLDAPVFINPTDMRVSAAGSGLARPIGVMGQWYMSQEAKTGVQEFTAADASTIEFFVEELKTQPAFPPIFIEYQAGWYCSWEDDRPPESPPANTLLSSRLALAQGLHGLNYLPLQDTVTPAGWSVPWANRSYRWDAALDPNGHEQPRARAVARNGQFLAKWGEQLAASHKRADFGIVYPLGAFPQEKLSATDILRVSQAVQRIERIGQLAHLSSEFLDPQFQPASQLLRHALILLPVFDSDQEKFQLSEKAQQALVEYVRRGGTLVWFPARPAGKILEELWKTAPSMVSSPSLTSAVAARWSFGAGQVIESTKDFYSWVALDEGFASSRARPESSWPIQVLRELLDAAGARPAIQRTGSSLESGELVVTQLVSNEGTLPLGARSGGQGFLTVSNLSGDQTSEEVFEILSPRSSATSARAAAAGSAAARRAVGDTISIHILMPPRESLLLPLELPLCSDARPGETCRDAVVIAGAELLGFEREGKTLELTFYTPAHAEVRLAFERRPKHLLLEDAKPEGQWDPRRQELTVDLPRGAAPGYLRVLKIELPYKPHVAEKPKVREGRRSFDVEVADAVRLPLGQQSSLSTFPPLVRLDSDGSGQLLLEAGNNDNIPRGLSIRLEGPLRGSASLNVTAHGTGVAKVKLEAARESAAVPPASDGLLHGTLKVRSGHELRSLPIAFLQPREGSVSRYQFDFDRDGANEWVLENAGLRLVVSPEAGGRALALVDKSSGLDLTTSVGIFRDHFSYAENPPDARSERARGRYGLFNRPYRAEWIDQRGNPALRLRYDAPDILPNGAEIEKTALLEGADVIRVDYRVQLHGPGGGPSPITTGKAAGAPGSLSQSFVAVNSVPAFSQGDRFTQFCWAALDKPGATPAAPGPKGASEVVPHCQKFEPGHAALELPAGAAHLEVRTPGRPGIALEWNCAGQGTEQCGKMTIEMKNFSALLRLQFSRLAPGGDPGEYSVRFRRLAAESPNPE